MIFAGEVVHHRSAPAVHTLRYPVYFYLFDLDELSSIHDNISFFSHNRANLVSLKDADYLRGDGSLRERILPFLKESGVQSEIGRIMLLTSARFMGYAFNPVSFYYCYDMKGVIAAVAAEVNNTFGEKHLYILDKNMSGSGFPFRADQNKEFHVSPFNNMEGKYSFLLSEPGEKIDVNITLEREEGKILHARLSGKGKPLTASNLLRVLLRFPVTALLTVPRIYKEAFKLFFFRKLKYFPKPEPSSEMTIGRTPP